MSFLGLNKLRKSEEQDSPKTDVINGLINVSSKPSLAKWIFKTHPETALNLPSLSQELRTKHMNVLLDITETLCDKKPHKISDVELIKASNGLSDLTQVGFNVEWLRSKHEEVCLKRKTRSASEARILELKQEVKKLEGMMLNLNVELKNEKAKLKKF